jgi:hypothetical protein
LSAGSGFTFSAGGASAFGIGDDAAFGAGRGAPFGAGRGPAFAAKPRSAFVIGGSFALGGSLASALGAELTPAFGDDDFASERKDGSDPPNPINDGVDPNVPPVASVIWRGISACAANMQTYAAIAVEAAAQSPSPICKCSATPTASVVSAIAKMLIASPVSRTGNGTGRNSPAGPERVCALLDLTPGSTIPEDGRAVASPIMNSTACPMNPESIGSRVLLSCRTGNERDKDVTRFAHGADEA